MNTESSNFEKELSLLYRLRFERGVIPSEEGFESTQLKVIIKRMRQLYNEMNELDEIILKKYEDVNLKVDHR